LVKWNDQDAVVWADFTLGTVSFILIEIKR